MFNVRTNIDISTIVFLELTKRARTKEVTGLLHVRDRLLAGESSRVEWSRGTLDSLPLSDRINFNIPAKSPESY